MHSTAPSSHMPTAVRPVTTPVRDCDKGPQCPVVRTGKHCASNGGVVGCSRSVCAMTIQIAVEDGESVELACENGMDVGKFCSW